MPPPSFQELPAELRFMIYGYLHVGQQAIELTKSNRTRNYRCHSSLSAAMLCTCKEIYYESSEVLMNENQFTINVSSDATFHRQQLSRISAPGDQDLTQYNHLFPLPASRLRNIKISLNLKRKQDYPNMYTSLHEICYWLKDAQRLSLSIEIQLFPGTERLFCVLEPLMLLRNVDHITFEQKKHDFDKAPIIDSGKPGAQSKTSVGTPPRYAEYLSHLLTESTPPTANFRMRQSARALYGILRMTNIPLRYKFRGSELASLITGSCHEGPFEMCQHK